MLMVEIQEHLVSAFILFLHLLVLKITTCSHPAVNLVAEGLNMLRCAQLRFEFLNGFDIFVARCEHAERDIDTLRVRGVDHGGVNLSGGAEMGAALSGQRDDFSAPAHA